jgi:hypothetical protein
MSSSPSGWTLRRPQGSPSAMRGAGFRAQFTTFVLAMMADNIEHVIS